MAVAACRQEAAVVHHSRRRKCRADRVAGRSPRRVDRQGSLLVAGDVRESPPWDGLAVGAVVESLFGVVG